MPPCGAPTRSRLPSLFMNTPVAMLVFNRPDHTARVLERVRAARPPMLLVVADGPRPGRADDELNCARVRALFERVDWPCEVVRLFSEANLGCKQRVGSGITDVLDRVESAIFLEDDCLPDPTLFPFCEELLERYRDDERVMMISGDCFPPMEAIARFDPAAARHSYHFTRYLHIWGWATWRRAWRHYDPALTRWPALRDQGWLRRRLVSRADALFWTLWFQACHDGRLGTWDVPWAFSCWSADIAGSQPWGGGGLAICPNRNLVSNLGFDGSGTHVGAARPADTRPPGSEGGSTRRRSRKPTFNDLPTFPMSFPLVHPPTDAMLPNLGSEQWTQRHCFTGSFSTRWKRWKRYLRQGLSAKA